MKPILNLFLIVVFLSSCQKYKGTIFRNYIGKVYVGEHEGKTIHLYFKNRNFEIYSNGVRNLQQKYGDVTANSIPTQYFNGVPYSKYTSDYSNKYFLAFYLPHINSPDNIIIRNLNSSDLNGFIVLNPM